MKKFLSMLLALILVLGMAVPAMAANVMIGGYSYTTDENGIMAYRVHQKSGLYGYSGYSGTVFNLYGKHVENWKQTAYSNQGFATAVIFDGESRTNRDGFHQYIPTDGNVCTIDNKLSLALDFVFTNEGKTLQIIYTVENISSEEIKYSLASGTDVQIGGDDSATITALGEPGSEYGFKMVSDSVEDYDSTNGYAQFNFFGANRDGVTPVSGFWYGEALYFGENLFTNKENKTEPFSSDAGCAWHWDDTLKAGEERVFSVLIGIGGKGSENVGGNFNDIDSTTGTVTLTQNGDKITNFEDATIVVKVGDRTLTPGTDYIIDEESLKGESPKFTFTESAGLENGTTITISITKDNKVINGEITCNIAPTKYTVTVRTPDNGTASADKTTAAEGETVTVTATPNSGYEIESIKAVYRKDGDTQDTELVVTDGKFTMPAYNVTVSATFKEIVTATTYTVTFVDCGETVSVQTVEDIAELVVPEEKGKLFYKFEGWYDEEGYKLDENYELTGDPKFTAKYSFKHTYNRPSDVVEEKSEDVAEANPSTGAPVFAPAVIVLSAAAAFLGKRK